MPRHTTHHGALSANAALERLREGNAQFIDALHNTAPVSHDIRELLAVEGQNPYAAILACADSRVVPEHIFMAGIGELFTVRVAGNIATETQVASLTYAIDHCDTKLIVVLGHTNCGAIGATLAGGASGCVAALTNVIAPAIGEEHRSMDAARLNVQAAVSTISAEPEIAHFIENNGVRIVGALYHLDTGLVEWM